MMNRIPRFTRAVGLTAGIFALSGVVWAHPAPPATVAVTPGVAGIVSPHHPWHQTFWVSSRLPMRVRMVVEQAGPHGGPLRPVQVLGLQVLNVRTIGPRARAFVLRGPALARPPAQWTVVWQRVGSAESGFQAQPSATLLLRRPAGTVQWATTVRTPTWIGDTTALVHVAVRNTGTTWGVPQAHFTLGDLHTTWVWPVVEPGGVLHETLRVPVAPWRRSTMTLTLGPKSHGTTVAVTAFPPTAPIVVGTGALVTAGFWWIDRQRGQRRAVLADSTAATKGG